MVAHAARAAHTAFDGVRIRIRRPRSGMYPDWSTPESSPTFEIPGSGRVIVQHMGFSLSTITFRLWFPDMAAYRAFAVKVHTVGTLTLLANYTRAVGVADPTTGATSYHLDGMDYEDLPNVELVSIGNVEIPADRVNIECDATFRAAINPATGATA